MSLEARTSLGTNYRCPACGAEVIAGDVTTTIETDIEQVIEMVEAWPGGPLIEDHSVLSRSMKPGRRWFSTDLCGDRFDMSKWRLEMIRYDDGRPDLLHLAPLTAAIPAS